ncbi:hypothetical protein RT953_002271 [Staphylococcus pseudintermedius]|nr:hypothetical protein [Staphylococcus pseudintermedius]
MNENKKKDSTTTKRRNKSILLILSITLLVIFTALIFYFFYKNNATSQIEDFKEDVKNNRFENIANKLSNNSNHISKLEAKHFVEYIKRKDNYKRFIKEIDVIKNNIKSKKANETELGDITDFNGKKLISVNKNGKSMLLINKISFEPHLYNVYVEEYDNRATYKYKLGKTHTAISEKNGKTKIGEFFVGNYGVKSKKTIEDSLINGSINGEIFIDTDNADENKNILAQDYFDQSSFKVEMKNSKLLDNKTLNINNHSIDYKKDKVYGKYPNQSNLIVYGKGEIDGKEFKTNTKKVNNSYRDKYKNITLDFKEDEIAEFQKENEKIKKKAETFISEYHKALNKAYKKADYKFVEKYIKEDTKLSKHTKHIITSKKKVKFSEIEIKDVERNQNDFYITVNRKINKNQNEVTYILNYNSDSKTFKITDIRE